VEAGRARGTGATGRVPTAGGGGVS